ncbi:MAG: ATP-binding protein [Deltaproteobacteria bacterium]|nr:ATP-binding protein [Deltaproteobacteria bacterium]
MDDFAPIEPNPYIVGNPIRDRSMFFGRQEDLRFLHDRLDTDGREMIVLCGGRRCGKTSILLQVLDGRLGDRFLTVLLDMQQLAELRSDIDLWRAVARRIVERMGERGLAAEGLVPPAVDDPEPHAAFRRFLEGLAERLGKRKLVLLVDEYELIEEHIHHGTLSNDVTLVLSAMLDSTLPLSFLFTGSRRVQERDPAVWSRLMGKAIHRRVSFLALGDAERLIREPVRGRMEYADDAVQSILRLTAGHPFYTQVICQALVDRMNEKRSTIVEAADVDEVAEALADSPLPQTVYWWKSLPLLARVVGSLLAAAADGPSRYVPAGAVEANLEAHRREYGFEVRRASVRGMLERMVEQEDLEAGDPRDTYRFRMDLIRRWLRVEHPVWEVIRDLHTPGTDLGGMRTLGGGRGRRWLAAAAVAVLLAAAAAATTMLWPGAEPAAPSPREARVTADGATLPEPGSDAGGPGFPDGTTSAIAPDGAPLPEVPETLRFARQFALRHQLPVPMHEIDERDLAGRSEYFVFVSQGEKLVRLEHHNGAGFPVAVDWSDADWWERATTLVFEYRENGSVERTTALRCGPGNRGCVPLAVLLVSPDGRSRRAVIPGREELPTWNDDRIAILSYEPDERGFARVTRNLNALGSPQPDRFGRVQSTTKRDADGWPIEETEEILDPDQDDRADKGLGARATRTVRYEYDERHNVVATSVFGGDGRPIRFPDNAAYPGAHRIEVEWDDRDRPTRILFRGPEGEPAPVERCFERRRTYDERGGLASDVCLGSDGRPAPDAEDVVEQRFEYDERGLRTVERSLGRGGVPVRETVRMTWNDAGDLVAQQWVDETIQGTDDEPVVVKSRAFECDERGRRIVLRSLDAEGRPVAPQGFATIRYAYDDRGQLLSKRYEGLDGKPTDSTGDEFRGVSLVTYEYDAYGFMIGQRFENARGKPVDSPYAAAVVRWKVDQMGRVLEEHEAPVGGASPVPHPSWPDSVRRQYQYDTDGNVVEERAFDGTGNPVPAVTGELVVHREFDHLGRMTAEWYTDAATPPQPMVGGPEQVARVTRTYAALGTGEACWTDADGAVRCTDPQVTAEGTGQGTVIETRFFGTNGKAAWSQAHGRGIHRVVSVRDAEQHVLEIRYFGTDERPAVNGRGIHMVRTRWSPAGPIEESYLGLDGLPVEAEQGSGLRFARRTWTYDDQGHLEEYRTWGADGGPREDGWGIAARVRHWVGETVVEERYLDAAGRLRAGPTGIARAVWDYDDRDRPIREAFYDASGGTIVPEGWVAELTAHRDATGRVDRFDLSPPLPFGEEGPALARVELTEQGANALAVPRGADGTHLIVEGVVALRYPRTEWGERPGCVGLDGRRVACAMGTEVLLRFLSAPARVSCTAGAAAAGDDRCEWVWTP